MSFWDDHGVETKVRQILSAAQIDQKYGRGRRFLSAYQVAIQFAHDFPTVAAAFGHPTGGEGHGPYGLTNYFARQLPSQSWIQTEFMSSNRLTNVEFDDYGTPLTTTANQSGYDMIMFRLIDDSVDDQ